MLIQNLRNKCRVWLSLLLLICAPPANSVVQLLVLLVSFTDEVGSSIYVFFSQVWPHAIADIFPGKTNKSECAKRSESASESGEDSTQGDNTSSPGDDIRATWPQSTNVVDDSGQLREEGGNDAKCGGFFLRDKVALITGLDSEARWFFVWLERVVTWKAKGYSWMIQSKNVRECCGTTV